MDFVNIFKPPVCKHSLFSRTHQHDNRGRNSGQLKRGTTRFCPSFHQANAPAFVPLHALGFFQSRKASKIRFVFPKRRSSGDASIVKVEAAGDGGTTLTSAAEPHTRQRQTRSHYGHASVLLANGFLRLRPSCA